MQHRPETVSCTASLRGDAALDHADRPDHLGRREDEGTGLGDLPAANFSPQFVIPYL